MGLEIRGTRKYYTRSKRVDGRVVRQYVGSGEFAEVMAELDALERAERQAKQRVEQAWHSPAV
jgi:hypothetical protein